MTDHRVDLYGELAGVHRRVGAGAVEGPTGIGPAKLFTSVGGYPRGSGAGGEDGRQGAYGDPLGATLREVTRREAGAYNGAVPPVAVDGDGAPCQEVVHRVDDPELDLRRLLPAPTNTNLDAGPFFCLGLALGSDPELGGDVMIHRLCVQGRDEISAYLAPGSHLDAFRQRAVAAGRRFPVTANVGLGSAVYLGAVLEAPTTPMGFDELSIAGGLRGSLVELVRG